MTTATTAAPQGAQQAPTQLPSQSNTVMKRMQEETVNHILERVNVMEQAGELRLPEGYNAGNALRSAWLYLQTIETRTKQKAIDVCTKESICECLMQMCIKGEHPMQHCYFIPCGNSLEYWERYTGKYMRAKRDTEVARVNAQVVYEGDEFTYTVDEDGQYQFVSHKTSIENIDIAKIKSAYAVVINKDGSRHLEIMTIEQIKKAWGQGAARGQSGAHTNFTDQMCKKTIIARACKIALDSTSDNEGEDLHMTPPDSAEAQREAANMLPADNGQQPKQITASAKADSFEVNAQYEEVASGPAEAQQATEIGAAKDTTSAPAKGRACPV